MGKSFLLTIDLEEFDRASGQRQFTISKEGLDALIPLLDRIGVPATFFTTASFASQFPETIRELSEKHEIALHALEHQDNYKTMERKEAGKRLSKAKYTLEDIIGNEYQIVGFRAPQMQAPEMSTLADIGLKYDSSLHPTYVPGRYSHHRETMEIHRTENVVRVPVSVTPILRQAYSWIWFRVGGVWLAKWNTRMTERKMDFITNYFHPWDFRDLRNVEGISTIYAWNTHRSIGMLERYLEWFKGRQYRFLTMGDYLKETGWLE
jgi:peptidoglycan/xylan/chitin deacetylase (PgdA/CDA1 family)